jgi:hypothetical protein
MAHAVPLVDAGCFTVPRGRILYINVTGSGSRVPLCPACRTPDLCAYDGCPRQPGMAVGFAHAPLRPILLPGLQGVPGQSRPSILDQIRQIWAGRPEPIDPRPLHIQVEEIMNAADPPPSPAPTLRGPLRRPEAGSKLTIQIARSGAAVLILGGELLDAATDAASLSEAVRAWYDGA